MNEFSNPFPDTPEVKLHKLLLEQGVDDALFRQLHDDEQIQDGEILVDVGMVQVAVSQGRTEKIREELLSMLNGFPRLNPTELPAFGYGPSYVEAGAILGSQRTAIALFAVGEALGFWQVITPKKLFGDAIDDTLSREMMGRGYITIERKELL